MLYKYSTMQHLHFYSSLYTSPLMLLPFALLLRMTFASMQLFIGEEELSQPSYDFSPSVMELTVGRFSSISPKLNLCSNSTANRGTTCWTGHSMVHNQHAYEDLYWWLKCYCYILTPSEELDYIRNEKITYAFRLNVGKKPPRPSPPTCAMISFLAFGTLGSGYSSPKQSSIS